MTAIELHRQAVLLRQSAQYAQAEASLLRAIEIAHDFAPAHLELGLTYRDMGQLEDAVDYLQLAVHFAPDLAAGWFELGGVLARLERADAARAAYRDALARDARHAGAWLGLGNLLKAGDDLAAAIDCYRSAVACEPASADAHSRLGYALYKADPDLQAAHAAFPWIATWDDHEVENDYADDRSENLDHPEWFLLRRAAAYKAYYEHMPLRREMLPLGSRARIYSRLAFGNLASFHVLDERQYRSPHACPRPGRGGANVVDATACPALTDPTRTMLGADQERWLEAGLLSSRTKWTVLAQQMRLAQFDQKAGPGREVWTDGWDGYPAARRKLVDFIADNKVANPIFIGGDVHMFFANDIKRDFDNPASPTVASEFVGAGITSQAAFTPEMLDRLLPENPHVRFADSRYRGYARVEVTQSQMVTDLRAMESVTKRDAACSTLASFVIEDGKAGPQKA